MSRWGAFVLSLWMMSGCVDGESVGDERAEARRGGDAGVNTGPLPPGCAKLEGDAIGRVGVTTIAGPATVRIDSWVDKVGSRGEYVGFAYTVSGGAVSVSVKASTETFTDPDGSPWIHPAGTSGRDAHAISNIVFCAQMSACTGTTETPAREAGAETECNRPIAGEDVFGVVEGAALTVGAAQGVLATDMDPNGDFLDARLITTTTSGTLALAWDGSLTYTPAPGFTGVDRFRYVASDGRYQSAETNAYVIVRPASLPPIGDADTYRVEEEGTLTIAAPGVLANDRDADGSPLRAEPLTMPAHGALTLGPDGSFSYVPSPDFSGTDHFTYAPHDGTTQGNETTVAIEVAGTSDAPTARDDAYRIAAGDLLVAPASVLANDADPDGEPLVALLEDAPEQGELNLSIDGSFTYAAPPGFEGLVTFRYRALDGIHESSPATVEIDVTDDTPPTITSEPSRSVVAGGLYTYAIVASDPEGGALAYELAVGPSTMAIDPATGVVLYLPGSGDVGRHDVVLRVRDEAGATVEQRFELEVTTLPDLNRNPIVRGSAVDCAVGVGPYEHTLDASDPDGDALTFALVTGPSGMTIDASGTIAWDAREFAAEEVVAEVSDHRGGIARHRFLVHIASNEAACRCQNGVRDGDETGIDCGGSCDDFRIVHAEGPGTVISNQSPAADELLYWTGRPRFPVDAILYPASCPTGVNCITVTRRYTTSAQPFNMTGAIFCTGFPTGHRSFDFRVKLRDASGRETASIDASFDCVGYITAQSEGVPKGVTRALDPALFSHLTVGTCSPENIAPDFTTTAPRAARAGEVYVYAASATDPDRDAIRYEVEGPAGMQVDAARGEIVWTPSAAQVGTHSVTLRARDNRGGASEQTFTIDVGPASEGPAFTSVPPRTATIGERYVYDAQVVHPSGLAITFALETAPPGMTIVPNSGLVQLDATTAGTFDVVIRATDASGITSYQAYRLRVVEPSTGPSITSAPITVATAATGYRYDVDASAAVGPLAFELTDAPAGMNIDSASGVIRWDPPRSAIGTHSVTLRAYDEAGATEQRFDLTVQPDVAAPEVAILTDAIASPGSAIAVRIMASDNVELRSIALLANGAPVGLDADGRASIPTSSPGLIVLDASATDREGNVGHASMSVRVIDPSDTTPPTITIRTPAFDATLMGTADVEAAIADPTMAAWSLSIARAGSDSFRELASGTTAVDGVLGRIDPTLLESDGYVVRVVAEDVSGNQSVAVVPVAIRGELKLGRFRVDFVDLEIPVVGIPIKIGRTYETLSADTSGDFGHGWRLAVSEGRIRETLPQHPADATELFAVNAFRAGTRVYVHTPDGRRAGFTFDPVARPGFLATIWHPRFRPDPGVETKLEVDDVPLIQRTDGKFALYLFALPWNPRHYTVVTPDEQRWVHDQYDGLQSITDRNQNVLRFTPDGIFASSGPSVRFDRDDEGRITTITDPDGRTVRYSYSGGDLTTVTDVVGQVARYQYRSDPAHYLEQLEDPHGGAVRTTYDDEGRIVSRTDALGNTIAQRYDVEEQTETVVDAYGQETRFQYDVDGNVTQTIDPLGAVARYDYDTNGRLSGYVDPNGSQTRLTRDARGNVTELLDANGGRFRFTYDDKNRVVTATNPNGGTVRYGRDDRGNVIEIENAAGVITTLTYDQQGRVTSGTDALGHVERREYGDMEKPVRLVHADGTSRAVEYTDYGLPMRMIDENGHEMNVLLDEVGRPSTVRDAVGTTARVEWNGSRPIRSIDANGGVTTYEYDAMGRIVCLTDPIGGRHRTEYDAMGRVVAKIDPGGRTTRHEYDAMGHVVRTTDPLGEISNYAYDAAGNLVYAEHDGRVTRVEVDAAGHQTAIVDAIGRRTEYEYDPAGLLVSVTTPGGRTWRIEYDVLGRPVRRIGPDGATVTLERDANGRVVRRIDANGSTTEWRHDRRGRILEVIDPEGGHTRHEYDAASNIVARIAPTGSVMRTEYDALNRPLRIQDDTGAVTSYHYDALGNLTSIRAPDGTEAHYEHDAISRLVRRIDPLGETTRFTYDASSDLTAVLDPAGNETRYEYDAGARLVREIDALGGARTFDYDGHDLTRVTDRNGRVRELERDALGRVVAETWSEGGDAVRTTRYGYDAFGDLVDVRDPDGDYHLAYDAVGRVVSVDSTGTGPDVSLEYTRDVMGEIRSITDGSGVSAGFERNGSSQPTRVTWSGGGVDPLRLDLGYDANGRPIAVDRFAGTAPAGTTRMAYDTGGRPTSILHRAPDGSELARHELTFGPTNRVARWQEGGSISTYETDAFGQLTHADHTHGSDEAYSYGANGNRAEWEVDRANRVLSDGTYRYAYDAEGNRIARVHIASGAITEHEYDHDNRIVRTRTRDADGGLDHDIAYRYDAFGRRIARIVDGVATYTQYTGGNAWADYDEEGTPTDRYLAGESLDELWARHREGAGNEHYLRDHLGSVRQVVDPRGEIVARGDYDSFGRSLGTSGDLGRYRFTGREHEAETGLYYHRARYYDPSMGQFLSEDPLGFGAGDLNTRRYVGNGPLDATDPTGLAAVGYMTHLRRGPVGVFLYSLSWGCIGSGIGFTAAGVSWDISVDWWFGKPLFGQTASIAISGFSVMVASCSLFALATMMNSIFIFGATVLALIALTVLSLYTNVMAIVNADSQHALVKGVGNLTLQTVGIGWSCINGYRAWNNRPPGIPETPAGPDADSIAWAIGQWGQNREGFPGACKDQAHMVIRTATAAGHEIDNVVVVRPPPPPPGGIADKPHAFVQINPGGPGSTSMEPVFYSWWWTYPAPRAAIGPGWTIHNMSVARFTELFPPGGQVRAPNIVIPTPFALPPRCQEGECCENCQQ